jgi:hypothetical protein
MNANTLIGLFDKIALRLFNTAVLAGLGAVAATLVVQSIAA